MIKPFASLSLRVRAVALAGLTALGGPIALIQPAAVDAGMIQSGDHTAYVLLSPGSQSSTMSGSMDDLRRARALRAGREGLLYVRQGGAAYVIRDAATLRQAETIFAPQQALGERQAELGSRQAALGGRQAALGAEQARLGGLQAGASPRRAEAFARQQAELGRQQDALGQQQDALGREQDRLGRQADAALRNLVAVAIRRGLAQRMH